jgi:hypothetical protein
MNDEQFKTLLVTILVASSSFRYDISLEERAGLYFQLIEKIEQVVANKQIKKEEA